MEKSVEELIKECTTFTKPELSLDGKKLDVIPDLSHLWWVERLDLSNNKITCVDRKMLPNNLKILFLNQNKIKNITHKDIPETVEALNLLSNEIKHFDGSQFKNLIKLNISVNCLETFYFPPSLVKLDVSTNTLEQIDDFPETLLKIKCSDNMLTSFPYINNSLIYADISDNKFTELPTFPESIQTIQCANNFIVDLWYIPENVVVLNLANNRIKDLYNYTVEFPKSLRVLNLDDNCLTELIDLPEGLVELRVKSNRLEKLPKSLPMSLKVLDISDNCLNSIPYELKFRTDLVCNYENNLLEDSDDHTDSGDDYGMNALFGIVDNSKKKKTPMEEYFARVTNNKTNESTSYNSFMLGTPATQYMNSTNASTATTTYPFTNSPYSYNTGGTTTYTYPTTTYVNSYNSKPKYIVIKHKARVVL